MSGAGRKVMSVSLWGKSPHHSDASVSVTREGTSLSFTAQFQESTKGPVRFGIKNGQL